MPMTSKLKILVAEDDSCISEITEMILKMEGYEVETAQTAEGAISAMSTGRFSAVILDITLPGMEIEQFVAKLKSLSNRPAIIILSARPILELDSIAARLGVSQVLQKPAGMDQLLKAVASATTRS